MASFSTESTGSVVTYLCDASNLANVFNVLTRIRFHYAEGSETSYYKNSSKAVQKRIQLLDSIALLFVYTPNHDIVATGLTKENDDYIVHWARNFAGHTTEEERAYTIQTTF